MKGHITNPYVRKTLSDLLLCQLSATGSKIFREGDSRVRGQGWQVIPRHGGLSRRYRQLNQIDRTDARADPGSGRGRRCSMQHHWPGADEQPTPMAHLTILVVRLLPDGPADEERPTPKANLKIETMPTLPLAEVGAAPPIA
jgi:hypothetical protein